MTENGISCLYLTVADPLTLIFIWKLKTLYSLMMHNCFCGDLLSLSSAHIWLGHGVYTASAVIESHAP